MTNDELRTAFEAVISGNGKWPQAIERGPGGTYLLASVAIAWLSWQEARDIVLAKAAETRAARDVLAERHRQVSVEGWSVEHDDKHVDGTLAVAAACYAAEYSCAEPPVMWPWDPEWWKPGGERRSLVKAGALILAEIERLDRAALAAKESGNDA